MFESLRKPGRAKGIFAGIIFGAIILVFALFGVTPDRMGSSSAGGAAAVVNDQIISLVDFRERLQRVESQVQMDALPEAQKQNFQQMARRRALEELISLEVLAQAASHQGVHVTDDEIRDRIVQIPVFQEDGRFKRDLYARYLEYAHLTASDFEEKVRKEIAVNRIQSLFIRAAQPASGEGIKESELSETKLDLKYIAFDKEELQRRMSIPQVDIQNFLKAPENLQKIKAYYDSSLAEFTTLEEVKARHILIRPDPEKKITEKDAKKLADEILARLKKGEDFGKLAKEYSADPVSAKNGGDLGYFSRGRMVPEFESAAFDTPVGKTSEVVKSQFGYHIVQSLDKKPAKTSSFEDVQVQLAKADLAKGRVAPLVEKLSKLVKEKNEKDLNAEVKALGLEWQETGEFELSSANIPGLGEAEKVLNLAVARAGQPGLIPELVESQGRYHIVRLEKVKAPGSALKEQDSTGRMLAYRRSGELLNSWVRKERDLADIRRNMNLVATQQ